MKKIDANGYVVRCFEDSISRYISQNTLHCLTFPACEFPDGTKYWMVNGLYHRVGGPSVEWSNGRKSWHLHGVEYSEEDFHKKVRRLQCVQL